MRAVNTDMGQTVNHQRDLVSSPPMQLVKTSVDCLEITLVFHSRIMSVDKLRFLFST